MAYQNADVLDYMSKAYRRPLQKLCADGGGSQNTMLMQLQADLGGLEVAVSDETELSALGSALMGGEAMGLFDIEKANTHKVCVYVPGISGEERSVKMKLWRTAVSRIINTVSEV